jgi:cobaltochelatase CobS
MKEGHWLLLDELDFCQPEYLATLQAVFEGNNTPLTLSDNGGEKIYPHKDFRIIATANTLGRGDTNGYHGTNMLNIATLDRWTIITMDYSKHENKLLAKIVDSDIAEKMVAVAKRVRNAIKVGELPDYVFSTRRLLHWAEAVVDMGFELGTEAEVLGRLLSEERKIISEFVYDTFGVRV